MSHRPGTTDRMVKYMAKSAAKNIRSLARNTMKPTVVTFGRLTTGCAGAVWDAVAVDTPPLLPVSG
ncbi:Uncharacterised protein [Mycobacteroides abscessus subsp. abscessus]|nr:Uncharacterised protein [Mycobacteroides abscessus subsp. abscessus]